MSLLYSIPLVLESNNFKYDQELLSYLLTYLLTALSDFISKIQFRKDPFFFLVKKLKYKEIYLRYSRFVCSDYYL